MAITPSTPTTVIATAERGPAQVSGSALRSALLLIVIAFLTRMALHQWDPPRARAANASASEFSAERAMTHVRQVAREPHWVGTPAHDAARDYVVSELARLGGQPEVEKTVGVWSRGPNLFAGSVQNVLARFPGTSNSHPLLLMAHYDSAEHAPGAADDASGTATILETLRALKSGPPLRNDLIVLITDGEEAGLLGAAAFVRQHAWAKDVGLVLNFEARGTEGPVLLFETSNDNGRLIREAAKAAPGVVGSSLMYNIYKRLPNDTDLSITKQAGLPGLNFAFIDGFENYHTRNDSPERLNVRTLQQEGEYALTLTRHFGNVPLPLPHKADFVFFNLSGKLMAYPAAWSRGIATGVLVLFIALMPGVLQSGKLKPAGKLGLAAVALIVTGVASLVAAWGVWRIIAAVVAGRMQLGATPSNEYLLLAAALTSGAVVAFVYGVLQQKFGWRHVALASALISSVVSVLVSAALPAGSYLLTWPAAAAVITAAVLFFVVEENSTKWLALAIVGAVPAIFFFAPHARMFLVSMTLGPVSIFAVALLAWAGALSAAPLVLAAQSRRAWMAPAILLLAGAACFSMGEQQAGFSVQHPGRDSLFYAIDGDQQRARWLSIDARPDAWTEKFLGKNPHRASQPAFLPGADYPVLSADAPMLPWAAPRMDLISDTTESGSRVLQLRVIPGREAQVLRLRSDGAAISAVTINGIRERLAKPGKVIVSYAAPPKEGVEVTLQAAPGHLVFQVASVSIGLPEAPGFPAPKLPDDIVAQYHTHMSVVSRKVAF